MVQADVSGLVSAAFFCPQARAPDEPYLDGLHAFLKHDAHGKILLEELSSLKTDGIWAILSTPRDDVKALSQGPEYIEMLHDWATKGVSAPLAKVRSGIVALPLLLIVQIGQYLRYLRFHAISHSEFLSGVSSSGGLQGYCGGLPSAMAIACAEDEVGVIKNTATAMRVVLGIGAYGEAVDDTGGSGSTTLALRLKYEGQGDDLTRRFPGTYVSAITDPRSVSIVGPAATLHELFCFARDQEGLQVQEMEVRGKVHNPENLSLAADLCRICHETPCLQLPDASRLKVPVRSNKSGQRLLSGSLGDELITTILASRCEWYTLIGEVAKDMEQAGCTSPAVVYFGLTDCVPMSPFHKRGLRPTKMAAHGLIERLGRLPEFPDNALAVVGASCRLPGANSLEELWDLLAAGRDCHQELPTDRFDIKGSFRTSQSGSSTKDRNFYGNLIDDVRRFDNGFFGVSPREATNMDPQQRILLELSHQALEDSGYLTTHRRADGDNVGCFIGASFVEYLDNTNAHAPSAYTSTGTIRAFLCGRLSYYYGWTGPAEVIDTACSSSLVAINRACKAIQTGECRMALAGGINIITGINNYLDLAKAGFLSPTGQCKPFDVSADGYCRSDGAGLVVLKSLKTAMADGDAILGVIPGVATNQGGLSPSITVPHSEAQIALYRNVLNQARLLPDSVTYVEAHGTGTQAGDPLEIESIRSVFGSKPTESRQGRLCVGSIKGNLGHCETAAGVAGLLKILAMMKHGKIPPQANHKLLNPKIRPLEPDGLVIAQSLSLWDVPFRAAMVNSYGAAGSNAALLCCEMFPRPRIAEPACNIDMAFPLMLSAASEKGLLENARVLGKFVRQRREELSLGDVAFTLNQRRKRQKFLATVEAKSIQDAAKLLESLDRSAIHQPPKDIKPVVFVLSGQYDNKVGLSRSFYQGFPAFRAYVDACDAEFTKLNCSSIIPTLFQTQPVDNVVALQCSIFAMQYACARCWIDAGLQPSAIVGHSFGELTALAVSGVLSLEDAIKLVVTRARLIDNKCDSEKGAMLALSSCSIQEFESISKLLQQRSSCHARLEIACYNAPNALVVAGTEAAVDAAENLLSTEPSLGKIRARRLATSHGFHSALMDPILDELKTVPQSLEWGEPKIPLEMCAQEPLGPVKDFNPSKHAREPVFFSESIRRVEARLGSVTWLEVGINTPVVPMVSKAVRQPDLHVFLPLKTQDSSEPTDAVSSVLSRLWRGGHFANHWRLLPVGNARDCKPVWLPPYQFEATQHWLPNVDRASEMQQNMLEQQPGATIAEQAPPLPPVSWLVERRRGAAADFLINTQTQRFREIVGGHAVRGRPLCPASMYMECVVMALQLLLDCQEQNAFPDKASLAFEGLSMSAPLGADPEGLVIVRLKQATSAKSWKFTIYTSSDGGTWSKPRETTHATGVVSLTTVPVPALDVFKRLVSRSMEQMDKHDQNTEKFMSKRAYDLFGRVVNYAPFFRAIRSVTLREQEALASIHIPDAQPGRAQSTSWKVCDTVTVDACIQVLGLLMNSSGFVAADEVMVMVGLDWGHISSTCQMSEPSSEPWHIYTKFGFDADQQPIGDVFVCTADGDMVAMFNGCRFSKLPTSKLERVLDTANRQPPKGRAIMPEAAADSSSSSSSTTGTTPVSKESNGTSTPVTSTTSARDSKALSSAMRKLIAEYTGTEDSQILEDETLADLGLDSLASVELIGELSSKFGIKVEAEDLYGYTLNDFYRQLGTGTVHTSVHSSTASLGEETHADKSSSSSSSLSQHPGTSDGESEQRYQTFLSILADVSGAKLVDIRPADVLADLGVDSLSIIDLKQELEEKLCTSTNEVLVDETVQDLMTRLQVAVPGAALPRAEPNVDANSSWITKPKEEDGRDAIVQDPFEVLKAVDACFDSSAQENGFLNYWTDVAPFQAELMIAYIVEAFAALGVDLRRAAPGDRLAQIPQFKRKHDKLVDRLWEILQSHDIVHRSSDQGFTRSSRAIDGRTSSQLYTLFQERFPRYQDETELMGLTGPKLADCLSGKVDAVSLMFGSPAAMKIMENYYSRSPMISTMTDQLVAFMRALLEKTTDGSRPVRILEVGAGTGGTTKMLATALASTGVRVQYTFTDISPSLVAKAKTKLSQYPWIEYASLNLEQELPDALRGRFDVAIGTNCVHATSQRTASCRRLRESLVPGGIVVLSEVTRVIDWYDICFGLLDGWWLAEGGTAYPLQPADTWMKTFTAAGFASASCSSGMTQEATSQQLLVACNKPRPGQYCLETVVYKEASDVQIHADIFFPTTSPLPSSPMPIALMIHGGGYMTLSRKAIRQSQAEHLVENGFLPVSIDYRLCPEVNMIEGPITDTRDAYQWVQSTLPQLAARRGFVVEPSKVVVVGWSTGGHLAMTLSWTAESVNLPPPTAILSFYAPVDFESGELDAARLASIPGRRMSLESILASLPTKPITNYDNSARGDSTNLGWVRPGDPRSELVIALFKEGIGMPLLFNGLPTSATTTAADWLAHAPAPERVAAASPLARLRAGQYRCPTFVIHGTADEVAPFASAERFVAQLQARGVRHGFLPLQNVTHIHDVDLRPGMPLWEQQVAPGYRFLFDVVRER